MLFPFCSCKGQIWEQTAGAVDALVHTVSTARSLHGMSRALRQHQPELPVYAEEPAESAVLSGQPPGSHKIDGISLGFLPPLWHPEELTEILTVSTEDAKAMARRLACEEAIFAGTSTGANVVAVLRIAARLGKGRTVYRLEGRLRHTADALPNCSWIAH